MSSEASVYTPKGPKGTIDGITYSKWMREISKGDLVCFEDQVYQVKKVWKTNRDNSLLQLKGKSFLVEWDEYVSKVQTLPLWLNKLALQYNNRKKNSYIDITKRKITNEKNKYTDSAFTGESKDQVKWAARNIDTGFDCDICGGFTGESMNELKCMVQDFEETGKYIDVRNDHELASGDDRYVYYPQGFAIRKGDPLNDVILEYWDLVEYVE